MKTFIDYLERMIDGCDALGGMEREKAVYQSTLKEYRKQHLKHMYEPPRYGTDVHGLGYETVINESNLFCHHNGTYTLTKDDSRKFLV